MRWYENDGHAHFTYHTLPALSNPEFVTTADINADGDIDVLAAGRGLWIYDNDGSGGFQLRTVTTATTNSISCADLDGDGDIDLWLTLAPAHGRCAYILTTAPGYSRPKRSTAAARSAIKPASPISTAMGCGSTSSPPALSPGIAMYPPQPGDFSQNQIVDGGDYVLSRKTQGSSVPKFSGADANGDGIIGSTDYNVWRAHEGSNCVRRSFG